MHEILGTMYRRRAVGLSPDTAKEAGLPYNILLDRVVRGMTLQEAIDLGDGETHRTWGFTLKDSSRIEHRALVRSALGHHVSVVQIIDELELGYEENRTLEQAVARAAGSPWPLPAIGSDSRRAVLVGLNPSTLHYRLCKGMSFQEASEVPARMHAAFRTSLDLSDLALDISVTEEEAMVLVDTLKRKRQEGHHAAGVMNMLLGLPTVPDTPDDLGRLVLDPGSPLCDGKINISALARHAGLEPATLRSRLHNGWDLREALTTPAGTQGRGAKRRLRGPEEEWPMYRKEAQRAQMERAGLTARIVWDRIKNGWDEHAAITAPRGARRKYNRNISELARKHGLGPETVRARLKKGWTLQEALDTPPRQPRPSAVVDSADAAQSEDSRT
jgi:transposase-like protein